MNDERGCIAICFPIPPLAASATISGWSRIIIFDGSEGTAEPIVRDLYIANGQIVCAIRGSIVKCPPLVILTGEIEQMIAIIRKLSDEAAEKLKTL